MLKKFTMLMVLGSLSFCSALENNEYSNNMATIKTIATNKFSIKVDDTIPMCNENNLSTCFYPEKKALNVIANLDADYSGFRKFILLLDKIPLCEKEKDVTNELITENISSQLVGEKVVQNISTEKVEHKVLTCYKNKDNTKVIYVELYKSITVPNVAKSIPNEGLRRLESAGLREGKPSL